MRLMLRPCAALAVSMALVGCGSAGSNAPASATPPLASASAAASAPASALGASPPEASPMSASPSSAGPSIGSVGPFTLTSSAFAGGAAIPRVFTCDGNDVSPPLAWTGVPAATKALVLVVDDPDANGWVHWIALDLPGTDGELPKAVDPAVPTPQQGTNDFGKRGWGGPCPPSGTHHYRFTLTALGAPLALAGHPGGAEVRRALKGAQVLGEARLTATYRRG